MHTVQLERRLAAVTAMVIKLRIDFGEGADVGSDCLSLTFFGPFCDFIAKFKKARTENIAAKEQVSCCDYLLSSACLILVLLEKSPKAERSCCCKETRAEGSSRRRRRWERRERSIEYGFDGNASEQGCQQAARHA